MTSQPIDTQILQLLKTASNLFASTLILTSILNCEGDVSGGEQTITESAIDLTGATLRVNNIAGSDSADGINEPYQTLQYALNQLRPGDVLVVESTAQAYNTDAIIGEELDADGNVVRIIRGYKVSTSGSQSAPIVIEGRGLNPPEINQGQSNSTAANAITPADANVGLLLDCVSHIVVRNLEIHSANEAGITTDINGGCETNNIVIEENHIHNIYGEKYVGGIRMMGVSNAEIRNNHIHDIFSNQSNEQRPLIKNNSGIHNISVENNLLESLDTAVAINAQGIGDSIFALTAEESISAIQIENNVFDNVNSAISFSTQISDAASTNEQHTGSFANIDIVGNTFEQVDSAAEVSADISQHQSHDICIYNNSLIDTLSAAIDITGVANLELFNNIFVMPQNEVLTTRSPANSSLINSNAYIDQNLFYDFVSLSWRLDINGANETSYPDLANWQTASTHPELTFNPDLAAIIADPLFFDPANSDYSLNSNSPAFNSGRFGLSIGADFTLSESIDMPGFPCADRELD